MESAISSSPDAIVARYRRAYRFAAVITVILVAAPLLRVFVVSELVSRADGYLTSGQMAAGDRYIRRALFIDPDDATAAEQTSFELATSNSAGAYAEATALKNAHNGDPFILRNFALTALHWKHYRASYDALIQANTLAPMRPWQFLEHALAVKHHLK